VPRAAGVDGAPSPISRKVLLVAGRRLRRRAWRRSCHIRTRQLSLHHFARGPPSTGRPQGGVKSHTVCRRFVRHIVVLLDSDPM